MTNDKDAARQAADAAELQYWRNVHEHDFAMKDRVDSLSHKDRINDLRNSVYNATYDRVYRKP